MKHSFFRRFNSIFFKTFIILIVSSILPVLAANWIIYRQSSALIQKQVWNTSLSLLEKSSEMVDLIFREIEQTQKMITDEKNVIQLAFNPHRDEVSRNYAILKQISNIVTSNEYIDSIYVYGVHAQIVLHSNGNIYEETFFSDQGWLPQYLNFGKSLFWIETRNVDMSDGGARDYISCVSSIPFNSESSKVGCVIINLDEQKIYEAIAGFDIDQNGEAGIISLEGKILAHSDRSRLYENVGSESNLAPIFLMKKGAYIDEYKGVKSLFAYTTGSLNNWKYVYRIPLELLYSDTVLVSIIIAVISGIYILLSFFLSFVISKGLYNPMDHLIGTVLNRRPGNGDGEKKENIYNEYKFLEQVYSDVFDENRSMVERLNNLKPLIKEKLFTNLISGIKESSKEIEEKIKFLGYNMTLHNYIAIVIQIDDYNEWCVNNSDMECSFQKVKLTVTVEDLIRYHANGVCIGGAADTIVAIVNYQEGENPLEIQRGAALLTSSLKERIENDFCFTVTLGIGRLYRDIFSLGLSYKEALNALKYKLYQGKSEIIDISDVDFDDELYYYHSERERIIINKLRTGDRNEVTDEIDKLLTEIHNNRAIPFDYLKNLFVRIISSMVVVLIDSGLTVAEVFESNRNLFNELTRLETLDDIGSWLKSCAGEIADAVCLVNQNRIDKNVQKLIDYIDEHLQDEISLYNLADVVGFSTSYVSRIFKESTGVNYIEYLSKKRIEKSKQLLNSTIFTIKEIGFRVGFNNIQSFLRTFKKYEGITPGQFRDSVEK